MRVYGRLGSAGEHGSRDKVVGHPLGRMPGVAFFGVNECDAPMAASRVEIKECSKQIAGQPTCVC